jgi:hypothetical protein
MHSPQLDALLRINVEMTRSDVTATTPKIVFVIPSYKVRKEIIGVITRIGKEKLIF